MRGEITRRRYSKRVRRGTLGNAVAGHVGVSQHEHRGATGLDSGDPWCDERHRVIRTERDFRGDQVRGAPDHLNGRESIEFARSFPDVLEEEIHSDVTHRDSRVSQRDSQM